MHDASVLQDLDSRREYYGISIDLPTAIAKEAKTRFLEAEWAQEIPNYLLLRDDNQVSVYFYQLDDEAKEWLHQQMVAGGHRASAVLLTALREAEQNPVHASISSLAMLAQAIGAYIKQGAIDGWVYAIGEHGEQMPWLVTNIALQEMSNGQKCVALSLTANTVAMSNNDYSRPANRVVFFFASDLAGHQTVIEILAAKGFMKETPELKRAYLESVDRFVDFVQQTNEQFIASGSVLEVNLAEKYQTPERLKLPSPMRVVNDEELIQRKFFTHADSEFWLLQGRNFSSIPMHPMILCFNLETHTNMWIHVNHLIEYRYDPGLREKLVLPSHHRDLIDILTQDMDVLMDDIVAGKSGGTTILCKGAPGLGKTLTAEVYAEVIGRPLYRVHSGQLGIHSEDVEKNLTVILKRAQRWGAVLLLDEADVYIRRRGNDIDHNAVVASFLRTLEYFHGLLFMTTNRSQDVDDAIASRCIATIVYEAPQAEDAKRIWSVLSTQFEFDLQASLVDQLVDQFPGVSGRDIKELLKLTAKWCRQKRIAPTLEVFKSCSQFRGL
ncbi:MAG: ATPase family protein [Burkholderiaceae bacterium]|nr:ATPase family protein [Burkholderiaceae bacterium]